MKVILICSVEYLGDTVIAGKFQKLPKEIVLTEIAAVFRIVTDCLLLQLINKKDLMNSANLLCYSPGRRADAAVSERLLHKPLFHILQMHP